MERSWYKRRTPNKVLVKPVSATLENFQFTNNHICSMIVEYSDGSTKKLISRVIFNTINKYWTVDGMEVAVKIID